MHHSSLYTQLWRMPQQNAKSNVGAFIWFIWQASSSASCPPCAFIHSLNASIRFCFPRTSPSLCFDAPKACFGNLLAVYNYIRPFPLPKFKKKKRKNVSAARTVPACPSGGQVSRARSSRPSPRRFRRSVGRRASGARAEGACPFVLLASRPGVVFLVETRPAERHRRRRFQPPERAARQHRAPARQLWRAGGGGPRGEGEGRLSAC